MQRQPREGFGLHSAALVGDHARIRALVAAGADINERRAEILPDATPLMIAAGSVDGASLETVELLLSLGADPSIRSPAEIACRGITPRTSGGWARFRRLVEAGSSLDVTGRHGRALLIHAAITGESEIFDYLWQRGVDPTTPDPTADRYGESPLFLAAESGMVDVVRRLAAVDPGHLFACDDNGANILSHAGSGPVVRVLLDAGVDALAVDIDGNDALIHVLACSRYSSIWPPRPDAAAELLAAGVPLERSNRAGWGRLVCAAELIVPEAVEFLLRAGHPVADSPSNQPLHMACWHSSVAGQPPGERQMQVIGQLIGAGFDLNVADSEGNTPLHFAAVGEAYGNPHAAQLLIDAGADVDRRNRTGRTPLAHHLHEGVPTDLVDVLLQAGADPRIPDNGGATAIDYARALFPVDRQYGLLERLLRATPLRPE